ncbi:hypothetical protein JCM24511_08142 [Saitozyma sp. JCM 24511]|nr:hypothetical protein JCM24511_08142 [Saitozyma sp. JCM 24511]
MSSADSTINDKKWMERDLFGYGPDRPDARWPNAAKIAVNCGERTVEDGDEHAETVLNEFGDLLEAPVGLRDPATESQSDYGSRVAIWRIMRLLKQYNIPITFYAVGRAFARNPAVARYAEDEGHEVAAHCYKWVPYSSMPAEKEELICKGVEAYKKTSPTGKVPAGVYRALGLGFLYWADTYADDLPYYTSMPGGKPGESLVMMPYSIATVRRDQGFSY